MRFMSELLFVLARAIGFVWWIEISLEEGDEEDTNLFPESCRSGGGGVGGAVARICALFFLSTAVGLCVVFFCQR